MQHISYETHEIETVIFNYNFSQENGEEFTTSTVGKNGVVEIVEHMAAGEGDKWYYDVYLNDGSANRIFNPNQVFYKMKLQTV